MAASHPSRVSSMRNHVLVANSTGRSPRQLSIELEPRLYSSDGVMPEVIVVDQLCLSEQGPEQRHGCVRCGCGHFPLKYSLVGLVLAVLEGGT
jgi:hypothetical protein